MSKIKCVLWTCIAIAIVAVTCSCIFPCDDDIPPYREPISVTLYPDAIETRVSANAAEHEEVRAIVLYDDETVGHDVCWDVCDDGIQVLSTAGGILRFRAIKPGTYTIRGTTMFYERKDGRTFDAKITVIAE